MKGSRGIFLMAIRMVVLGMLALVTAAAAQDNKEVTVTSKDFTFTPDRLELTKGDELVITFKNAGRLSHNLTFPALDKGTQTIQSGDTTRLTLAPGTLGTYEFICTVPGHANQGMRGTLVVTE